MATSKKKPASGKSKADILKDNKAKKALHDSRPKLVKAPLGGKTGKQPKKKKTIEDHIEEATGVRPSENGQAKKEKVKKLTTDELAAKLKRELVIRYLGIDSENNFLILNADDLDKTLPRQLEKDIFKVPVHKKLITAMQKLRVHAAILTNYILSSKYKKISDIPAELYKDFNITSVHFKYPTSGNNIQINATLTTELKTAFNFTTPIQKLSVDTEKAYKFAEDLVRIRENIFDRIESYISGDERGDIDAIGMFAESPL